MDSGAKFKEGEGGLLEESRKSKVRNSKMEEYVLAMKFN